MSDQKREPIPISLTDYSKQMVQALKSLKAWNAQYKTYEPLLAAESINALGAKTEQCTTQAELQDIKAKNETQKPSLGPKNTEGYYVPTVTDPKSLVFAILYHDRLLQSSAITFNPNVSSLIKGAAQNRFNKTKEGFQQVARLLKQQIDTYIEQTENHAAIKAFFGESTTPEDHLSPETPIDYPTLKQKIDEITARPPRDIHSLFAAGVLKEFEQLAPATVLPEEASRPDSKQVNRSVSEAAKVRFQEIEDALRKIARAKQLIELLERPQTADKHFSEILKDHKSLFDRVMEAETPDIRRTWQRRWNKQPEDEKAGPGPSAETPTIREAKTNPASNPIPDKRWYQSLSMPNPRKIAGVAGTTVLGLVVGGPIGGLLAFGASMTTATVVESREAAVAVNSNTEKEALIALAKAQITAQSRVLGGNFNSVDYDSTTSQELNDLATKTTLLKSIFTLERQLEEHLAAHPRAATKWYHHIHNWLADRFPSIQTKKSLEVEIQKLKEELGKIREELSQTQADDAKHNPIELAHGKTLKTLNATAENLGKLKAGFFGRTEASIEPLAKIIASTKPSIQGPDEAKQAAPRGSDDSAAPSGTTPPAR